MKITKTKLRQIIREEFDNAIGEMHDPRPEFQRTQDEQEEWEALEHLAHQNAAHDAKQSRPPNPRPDIYRGTHREEAYAELYQAAYDRAAASPAINEKIKK